MKTKNIIYGLVLLILGLAYTNPSQAGLCSDGETIDDQCCNIISSSGEDKTGSLSSAIKGYNSEINPNWGECRKEINFHVGYVNVEKKLAIKFENKNSESLLIDGNGVALESKMGDSDQSMLEVKGSQHVTIRDLSVTGDSSTFFKCASGQDLSLEEIYIQNVPNKAIVIEGCSTVNLQGIHVLGSSTGNGEDDAIILIKPADDVDRIQDVTINGLYFEQGLGNEKIKGTGLKISHADNVTINGVEADSLDGVVVKLDDINNLYALGVATTNVSSGVYLNNIENSQDVYSDINLTLNGNSEYVLPNAAPDYAGVGLFLDQNIVNMEFSGVLVENFTGDGVLIRDASNDNIFTDLRAYNNGGNGMTIEGEANGNDISSSTFWNNKKCGLNLSSSNPNIIGDGNEFPNNGNGCAVGGVGLTLPSDVVKMFPYKNPSGNLEVLVDVNRNLLDNERYFEMHFLTSRDGNAADFGDETSHITSLTIEEETFPKSIPISTLDQQYFVLIKNPSKHVIGIWEGTQSTTNTDSIDPNCYDDPDGTGRYRIYVQGQDTDLDGLDDDREDKNMNCIIDAGESDPNVIDTDGDGLNDFWENQWGTDPQNPDTDGDGLKDGAEDVNSNGILDVADNDCNPLDPDTDGDGLEDSVERSYGTGCQNTDSDNDGLADGDPEEKCPMTPGDQDCYYAGCVPGVIPSIPSDFDGDGIIDSLEDTNHSCAWEPEEDLSDPRKIDTDGDGIPDGKEDNNHNGVVDENESDPNKVDTDGDCIPDGLEDKNGDGFFSIESKETDPTKTDSDGDGLPDGTFDNGITGEDRNCNGVADPGETLPWNDDTDGDGLKDGDTNEHCPFNIAENCVVRYCGIPGYDHIDTDKDGATDAEEDKDGNCAYNPNNGESDPLNPDTDGDGLLDGTEICFGTNVNTPDTDGDGRTDFEEVQNSIPQCPAIMYNLQDTNPLKPEFGACSLNATKDATNGAQLPIIIVSLLGLIFGVRIRKGIRARVKR